MASSGKIPDSVTRNYEAEVVTDAGTPEVTSAYYITWAQQYNNDMVKSDYNGFKFVCNAFMKLDVHKDAKILDILAGTGLVGEYLKEAGYTNVDGQDGCQEMLDTAKEKELYKEYVCCLLGGDYKAPISDGTYDVLIMSGAFAPGHLYADVFPELLRITKKGGYICWAMRAKMDGFSPKFLDFDKEINRLVATGSWKYHFPREQFPNYVLGYDGCVYVMQKLKD